MKHKPRHPLNWFRIGLQIVKDSKVTIFTTPITIESAEHAKALHASQDRGFRYYKF